jgi:prophage DNA circulation protein
VPTSAPTTVTQGANPGGDFCTLLKAEKVKAAKLSSTISTAFATNDFATTKKALTAYFDALAQDLAQVEASMTDAPADVQAAVQTVNQFFTQLQSSLANASSLTDLQTSFTANLDTAALKSAGKVLSAYTTSQCGTQSP